MSISHYEWASCWGCVMEISSFHAELDGSSSDQHRHVGLSSPSRRCCGCCWAVAAIPPDASLRTGCRRHNHAVHPPLEPVWSITWAREGPVVLPILYVHTEMLVSQQQHSITESLASHHLTAISLEGVQCCLSLAQQYFLIIPATAPFSFLKRTMQCI